MDLNMNGSASQVQAQHRDELLCGVLLCAMWIVGLMSALEADHLYLKLAILLVLAPASLALVRTFFMPRLAAMDSRRGL